MTTKPLIKTNPYLKDAATRKKLIARSVRTSCGVEGIKPKQDSTVVPKITHRKDKKIYKLVKRTVRAAS
ncbi:hypothetical protein [Aquicella siphonis]|nr:hypothetical protein [Aquicella siphonis]